MTEVPPAGKHRRQAVLVGGGNHFRVSN